MALMEVWDVAVPRDLWQRVQQNDEGARLELRAHLDGLDLYCHAMPVEESEIIVPISHLMAYDLVEELRLKTLTPCQRLQLKMRSNQSGQAKSQDVASRSPVTRNASMQALARLEVAAPVAVAVARLRRLLEQKRSA